MDMLDWGIVGIILISTLISLWRGAVREIFSLATWLIAAFVGFKFNALLIPFFTAFTQNETLQLVASFLTLVILVVIIGTIIGVMVSNATSTVGLGGLDKILGLGFGCARGILIIALVVLFAKQTELPSQQWWKDSALLPSFETMSGKINDWLKEQGYDLFAPSPKKTQT